MRLADTRSLPAAGRKRWGCGRIVHQPIAVGNARSLWPIFTLAQAVSGTRPLAGRQSGDSEMRYFQPRSLTWWAGLMACTTGIVAMALPAEGPWPQVLEVLALLTGSGDASPAGMVFLGLGLIGLRDRIERGFRPDA
jgi:hypothetical protein